VPKILEVARAHGADLIVAGKKRKVMPESFVGSDMLHLLRESPLPVMVNMFMVEFKWKGERASRTNEAPFRRPLLAVDWTEASLKALRFLKALRGAVKEEVLLAHVLQEPLLRKLTPQELKAHKEAVGAKLQALRQELEAWGLKAQAHLLVGQPLKELLEAQRALGASMVIMGTTRKGTVKELFVGSLSHRMAEDSELPVLLVP
jgi:nucleotide-binding universal stress UspA family protein